MQILLTQDVEKLGHKDQLMKVKDGYARNYLFPKGYAVLATEPVKKVLAEKLKQRAHKEEKVIEDVKKIAKTLKGMLVKVGAKAGEQGKIFGSVTSLQLATSIKLLGFDVDRKDIVIKDEPIKTIGKYEATITFHKDIVETIHFEVVAE